MKIPTWKEPELITTAATPCGEEEISTSQETWKQKRSCRVRFADEDDHDVCEVPSLDDYSVQEKHATWFSPREYSSFRSASQVTIGMYRAGMLCGDSSSHSTDHHGEDHCMRGLEGRLADACQNRYQQRYQAASAVLNEQYRQQMHGYRSVEQIADLCLAVTWKSQQAAYSKALLDQELADHSTVVSRHNNNASSSSNVLRKVIAIERNEDSTVSRNSSSSTSLLLLSASSCSQQAAEDNFDINSFFSALATATTSTIPVY